MAHQLMRAGAADPLDAEGKGSMLQNREMPHRQDFVQQSLPVETAFFQELVDGGSRIAQARRGGDDLLRFGGMGEELHQHESGPCLLPAMNRQRRGRRKSGKG